uniref:Uncharacterized protein n=1 Tax=Arundo donax TaxID=35708 RepID=A0A0A9EB39_ARUDO
MSLLDSKSDLSDRNAVPRSLTSGSPSERSPSRSEGKVRQAAMMAARGSRWRRASSAAKRAEMSFGGTPRRTAGKRRPRRDQGKPKWTSATTAMSREGWSARNMRSEWGAPATARGGAPMDSRKKGSSLSGLKARWRQRKVGSSAVGREPGTAGSAGSARRWSRRGRPGCSE